MPIKFRCKHCKQFLGISRTKAGEIVDCPTCGRSVRVPSLDGETAPVPPPKMDLQDSNLVNALDALATIGQDGADENDLDVTIEESPVSAEVAEEDDRDQGSAIAPAPTPEPIAIEPAAAPVVLDPPEPIPLPEPPAAPVPEPVDTTPALSPIAELAGQANIPPAPAGETQRSSRWWLVAVALLVGCGLGVAGRHMYPRPDATSTNAAEDEDTGTTGNEEPEGDRWLTGRVSFRSLDGDNQPDRGARVLLLPESRSGEILITASGIHADADNVDFQISESALRILGGGLAIVDDDGSFRIALPAAGEYRVLVLSHFQGREEEDSVPTEVTVVLDKYFDRADRLLGRRKFHLASLRYKGAGPLEWNHTF